MKKLLLAGVSIGFLTVSDLAFAADYQPEEPLWSWNGAYIGVAGAWLWDNGVDYKPAYVPDFHVEHDLSGGMVGGQVGARVQRDWFVGGVELQGFWADAKADRDIDLGYGLNLNTATTVDTVALGKVKLGVAMDRWWLFGLGGIAVANLNPSASVKIGEVEYADGGRGGLKLKWDDERFQGGWVVGAGLNYSISDSVIVGVEWNRIDLGNVEFASPVKLSHIATVGDLRANSDFVFDVVQASLSFNF